MAGLFRTMSNRSDEHRLTRIETEVERQSQIVLGGLVLMLIGSFVLVKVPVDKLTEGLAQQNGRVTASETVLNLLVPRIEAMGLKVENHDARLKFQSWLFGGVVILASLAIALVGVLK